MLQLVGLIVGIYCMTRMLQVPLEMANVEGRKVFFLYGVHRIWLVTAMSVITFFVLAALTLCVLFFDASEIMDQLNANV